MRYWAPAALLLLLLSGIVVYFLGDTGRRAPEESAPLAVESQEPQQTPVEPQPPKPTKRAAPDIKIKKPAAGAAPSAPVQPPD